MRASPLVLVAVVLGCKSEPAPPTSGSSVAPNSGEPAPSVKTASPPSSASAATPTSAYPVGTSLENLLAEYKDNEVRADAQFKGKLVRLRGTVGQVSKDPSGAIFVTLGTGAEIEVPVAQCLIATGEEAAAAALSRGSKVMMQGRVDGLMGNVVVRDCVINPVVKLCERLRASLGEGKCREDGIMLMKDGKVIAGGPLFCEPDTNTYEAAYRGGQEAAKKNQAEKKLIVQSFGSRAALCFGSFISKEPLPEDIKGKIQAFFDNL